MEHMTRARLVCLGACLAEMSQYLQVIDLTSFLPIVRKDIGKSRHLVIIKYNISSDNVP